MYGLGRLRTYGFALKRVPMSTNIYEFGSFRLDQSQLLEGDRPVSIPPKELETLLILVQNHGRVVTKQELMERVWPDVYVEEGNLARHISYLRSRLGDSASGSKYVETVPKRGYRFVAPVLTQSTDVDHRVTGHGNGHRNGHDPSRSLQRTGAEMAADGGTPIAANLAEEESHVVPSERKESALSKSTSRPGLWILLAVGISLAVVGGIILRFVGAERQPFEKMTITQLTDSGAVTDATISADGKYAAYVESFGQSRKLWLRHLTTNSLVEILTVDTHFLGVTFSPDNDYIYFVRLDRNQPSLSLLYRVPVLGGQPEKILEHVDTPVSFSPSGKQFTFIKNDLSTGKARLMVANADGSGVSSISVSGAAEEYVGFPTYSPDGRTISTYMTQTGEGAKTALVSVDLTSGNRHIEGQYNITDGQPIFDGRSGFISTAGELFTNGRSQIIYIDQRSGRVRQVTNDLDSYGTGLSATSDSQKLIAVRKQLEGQLWVLPMDERSAVQQITNSDESLFDVNWRTSGLLTRSVAGNVALRETNGSGRKVLLQGTNVLSIDGGCNQGRYIVYTALIPGSNEGALFRAELDGTGPKLLQKGLKEPLVACSPVGPEVFFSTKIGTKRLLKRTTLEGGPVAEIMEQISWDGRLFVSPDGERLSMDYVVPVTHRLQDGTVATKYQQKIGVLDTATQRFLFSMDVDFNEICCPGRFTADSNALVLRMTTGKGINNLWLQPIGNRPPRQLTFFDSGRIFDFDVSPDGRSLVIVRGKRTEDAVLITDIRR